MRKPHEDERVKCPPSGEMLIPERCWDSKIGIGRGKGAAKVVYGVFKKHHHHNSECEYSGNVAIVTKTSKLDPTPQPQGGSVNVNDYIWTTVW